jgi:2-C-methyl-D-erythritol 4-phosphate cytidylyltransferase
MKTDAIIPAAGSGRRFGGIKQFEILGEKPLLLHTLQVFEMSGLIGHVILVVRTDDLEKTGKLIAQAGLKKVRVVAGGDERQDSVRKGFAETAGADFILVHDGVRPFVTEELISKTLEGAKENGACIVGMPSKETLKKVSNGFISETVDRSSIWTIQTPQVFRRDLFQKALEKAEADGFLGTDEAMLVERLGVKIRIIEGNAGNIKVTTPEDLKIAEALLKNI